MPMHDDEVRATPAMVRAAVTELLGTDAS